MNKDQIEGSWEILKAKAKKAFGNNLTEEMLDSAKNNSDLLMGVLQKTFGDTKEALKAKLDAIKL